ncbi:MULTISPECIES: YceI family protein [unclassified Pseudomonas]|uniref:YceI family protein n=1 Tax=unclassified Pseudomonas TaxID=196821 RepID=UPI00128FBCD7|nr:YceI family protein [Pseudomonas sp. MN1F]MQG92528.1 YceI family protein [Pseudomonas sp. MN1F]
MLKKTFAALALGTALFTAGQAMAAEYKVDKEGQHAFVDFKISHLGYSFITGTFKDWDGNFSWDPAKPEASKIDVTLKTVSVDTNHAERDKHIKSKDFLDVAKYPTATFKSTKVTPTGKNAEGQLTADVAGDLTLTGVTKPVVIKATFIGEGKDPWGGYRAGFEGKLDINRKDFAPKSMDLGPLSEKVELYFVFEGVQQK